MEKERLMILLHRADPFIKRYRTMILLLFAGILVLWLSSMPKAQAEQPKEEAAQTQTQEDVFELSAFERDLEKQLGQIQGVGRVSLTLTLKSTQEEVYAADVRESKQNETATSYESSLTMMENGSYGQQPVPVKKMYPTFRGALVLCDGAENATVQLAVTQAVSAVCGIGADQIAVQKMQG